MGRTKRAAQKNDKGEPKKAKVAEEEEEEEGTHEPATDKQEAKEPQPTKHAAEKPKKGAKSGGLAPGDDLPEFEVENDEGEKVSSSDLVKESGLVIFFYPKANTGGCTTQAIGFNDNLDKLQKAGFNVVGMSADKPKSQANWRAKHSFKYNLLCDPSYEVLKQLGVTKGPKGINRSHIVVEKGGKVKEVRVGISPKDSVAEAVKTCTA